MKNGWTGGQYSVLRTILGLFLCVHCVQLVPSVSTLLVQGGVAPAARANPLFWPGPNVLAWWDGPVFVTALVVGAAVLSLMLMLGVYDRMAAIALWCVWACCSARLSLFANPSVFYVGWLLLAHACLPAAPYGSVAAWGRSDPGNNWQMPAGIFLAAWVVMAAACTYRGITKLASPFWVDGTAIARVLDNPLACAGALCAVLLAVPDGVLRLATWGTLAFELGFAPLALVPRLRPWLWGGLVCMHLVCTVLSDGLDCSLGMLLFYFSTWDPAWIPPRMIAGSERIFYDGQCGLCHRTVRFVLAEDRAPVPLHFAPLESTACRRTISATQRATLPDSVIVHTADGRLLSRSAALCHILYRLGGLWRVLGFLLALLPLSWRDGLYDGIARVRHRLFRKPAAVCPMLPAHLRARFEL